MDAEKEALLMIIKDLTEQIARLNEKNDALLALLEEKNHRKTSRNSSVPPSSEGYSKPAPKSQRKPSGKKPGGQKGHGGSSMNLMKTPDDVVPHYPSACKGCPNAEFCRKNSRIVEKRYEVDIVVKSNLTAHLQMACCCPRAENKMIQGAFPANITGTKQYGNNLKAFAAALSTVGMMGLDRIHELLTSTFQLSVSAGTIESWLRRLQKQTAPAVKLIKKIVEKQPVVNADETGLRVNGSLYWLHCLCNERWSYLELHSKRGKQAMEDIGILPRYHGIAVHDFWKPYYNYGQMTHAICNAHISRELTYAEEEKHQSWAQEMRQLLLEMNDSRKLLDGMAQTGFQALVLESYRMRYDRIVEQGLEANPLFKRTVGQRGRLGKGKIRCLLERLRDYKDDILRFAADWRIPFTNNEAERSIRFSKVKQKVAGCFRTESGAEEYAQIMSFVNSARKHGLNYFEAMKQALNGNALSLVASWM